MWKLESRIIQYKRLFLLKEGEKHLQDRNNQNEILEPKHGGLLNLDDDSWDHWHQGGYSKHTVHYVWEGVTFPKIKKSPSIPHYRKTTQGHKKPGHTSIYTDAGRL